MSSNHLNINDPFYYFVNAKNCHNIDLKRFQLKKEYVRRFYFLLIDVLEYGLLVFVYFMCVWALGDFFHPMSFVFKNRNHFHFRVLKASPFQFFVTLTCHLIHGFHFKIQTFFELFMQRKQWLLLLWLSPLNIKYIDLSQWQLSWPLQSGAVSSV